MEEIIAQMNNKNGWMRDVRRLESKGYIVTPLTNQYTGEEMFRILNPATGKIRITHYSGQITKMANNWLPVDLTEDKSEPSASNEKYKRQMIFRRKDDKEDSVLMQEHDNLPVAIANLERRGFTVELPNKELPSEKQKYTVMDSSGELYTTRRANDIVTIAHFISSAKQNRIDTIEIKEEKDRLQVLRDLFGKTLTTRKFGDLNLFRRWGLIGRKSEPKTIEQL